MRKETNLKIKVPCGGSISLPDSLIPSWLPMLKLPASYPTTICLHSHEMPMYLLPTSYSTP